MIAEKRLSRRKACRLAGLSRNALAEPAPIREVDVALQDRTRAIAKRYRHWGLLKIHRVLRRQGETVNHKRVRRLYKLAGLNLPRKVKKQIPAIVRQPLPKATACNGCWSLDFTADSLADGRSLRTLNVLDDYNREALVVEVAYSLPSQRVIRLLDRLVGEYGKPGRLRCDHGPEFISHILSHWCSVNNVILHRIEPGKPTQNAYIERFNGTFRREVLNAHLFSSLGQVRQTVAAWLVEYNTERPHQGLQFMTPVEYRQAA
jgi:putative transposase